jgi:hypothetical protein
MTSDFEKWTAPLFDRAEELHRKLALHGIRLFALRIRDGSDYKTTYWIHDSKTVDQWRDDVREFNDNTPPAVDHADGYANSHTFNALFNHLGNLGYSEADDVVADVFEGRITNEQARVVHEPAHEEQPDGFGHYGWESKGRST